MNWILFENHPLTSNTFALSLNFTFCPLLLNLLLMCFFKSLKPMLNLFQKFRNFCNIPIYLIVSFEGLYQKPTETLTSFKHAFSFLCNLLISQLFLEGCDRRPTSRGSPKVRIAGLFKNILLLDFGF